MAKSTDSFDQAYGEGCDFFNADQYDAAIAAFSRAAALRPDDFRPWEMTGCCYGGLAQWEDSLAAFERARDLGHECEQCCYNRSIALCQLHRAVEAIQALERSLELEPNNSAAWYKLGLILGMAHGRAHRELEPFDGRHERAVAAFDRVLALEPNHYGAWYCKAYTMYKCSHSWSATQGLIAAGYAPDILQQALACVEEAIALQPDRPEAASVRDDILAWIAESTGAQEEQK
jgi:tetratricopeptide (TPR) repeat protein